MDLKAQYRSLSSEVEPAILKVLAGGSYILGPEVDAFEKEFAAYLGAQEAVGISSGLDALKLALLALGVGPGDEVITAANTFIATALAITGVGARPVLVDPDEATNNIDAVGIRAAITPKTKAIIPVHLYGQPAPMGPIMELAREKGIFVVEDACQAHGASVNGRRAGTIGHLGCFSFYPGKNLGAYGDGGAVVTDRKDLADKLRRLRNYGQEKKYHHLELGHNHRLDEVQASILRIKLRHLDDWNERRRANARLYEEKLAALPVKTPRTPEKMVHVFHLYVIRTNRRDALLAHLSAKGVGCIMHYPVPIHLQPAYRGLGLTKGSLPVSERLADEILSIPMFPELTEAQIDEVVGAIRSFFAD